MPISPGKSLSPPGSRAFNDYAQELVNMVHGDIFAGSFLRSQHD
jgi:hypothetical protein